MRGRIRKTVVVAGVALLLLAPQIAPAAPADDEVKETSFRLTDGSRVLRHEAIVAAPREQVFAAFTTSEGLRSFAAPVVAIDLRIGGDWEATYDPHRKLGAPGNIHNEVLAFLPPEMLTIRVREAPPRFPHPEIVRQVWTVIQLEDAGNGRTRVVISMLPYRDGADWDVVYELFRRGNAIVMRHLQDRFATGKPVDWTAAEREARPGG